MSGRYAEGTSVPIDRSIGEIRQTLERYGAEGFGYGAEDGRAMVVFKADGRLVRFVLPLPSPDDPAFTRKRRGRRPARPDDRYQAELRRRWRALALGIKGKLEAVESQIQTFEEEFLANIVMANGRTVGEWMSPQLEAQKGKTPRLLEYAAGGQT